MRMSKAEKKIKQRRQWEKMKKRGELAYVAFSILIFAGASFLYDLLHFLCFRLGWVHSPTSESYLDLIGCAVIAGILAGELEWSDMKRKFDTLPPGEDWTMK